MNKQLIIICMIALLLTACGGKDGIYGKVTDGDNQPITDATVELECTSCSGLAKASGRVDSDGNYFIPQYSYNTGAWSLTIIWNDPPDCPGITPFETLTSSGDWLITFAGYGGLGGTGEKRVIAVAELELKGGQSRKMNLKITCP